MNIEGIEYLNGVNSTVIGLSFDKEIDLKSGRSIKNMACTC